MLAAFLLAFIFGITAAAAGPPSSPYLVIDADRGTVLVGNNAHQLWYAASLTKLMTAYLVFSDLQAGRLRLSSPVVISKNALSQPPSKMGFKVGTVLTVDNALKMMLVHSANDIAMALGETAGGSEDGFVQRMNAEAVALGMTQTRFINPNGLPGAGQQTTARDLAVLARAVWEDFPGMRPYFDIGAIRSGNKVLRSQNVLLERYPGANGMKTGFICSSGFNMIVSATRNGRTVIAVVLGAPNPVKRAQIAAGLLDQAFAGWNLGFARPNIASYVERSPLPTPADLRPYICQGQEMEEEETGSDPPMAELGPPVRAFEPVRVFTGGADPLPGDPPVNVPLPRPRPAVGPAGMAQTQ
jgi:D-alanyl-D-alanine carboxypeptidase